MVLNKFEFNYNLICFTICAAIVSHTRGCCGQPYWQQWTMCQINELCSGNTLYVGTSRDIDSVVSEEVVRNRQFPLLITVVFTVIYFILTAV